MATKKKTKSKSTARKPRLLSSADRYHFVRFFGAAEELQNVGSPGEPRILLKKGRSKATGPNVVHVRKATRAGGSEIDGGETLRMLGLLGKFEGARRVEKIIRRMLDDNREDAFPEVPGLRGKWTIGRAHLEVLHDAYVFPQVIATKLGEVPTVYLDGKREVFHLAGGEKLQARNHKLVGRPDLVPGLEARAPKSRAAFADELERACRAFERARRAAGVELDAPKARKEQVVLKAEAARRLNRSKPQIQRMIDQGKLQTRKVAGREMVVLEDDRA